MKILFQRETYDMTTFEAIKNELRAAISLEFLYKQSSSNEKISYTLLSPINHGGDSFDCGHMSVMFLMQTQEFGGTVMMTISLKLVIYQKGLY